MVHFRYSYRQSVGLLLCCIGVFFASCQTEQNESTISTAPFTIESAQPRIIYAEGVGIEHLEDNTHRIWVKDVKTQDTLACFRLVPNGQEPLELSAREQLIRIPLQRVACMSLTFVGGLELLGVGDRVVAVSDTALIYDPLLRSEAQKGKIASIARHNVLDREQLLSIAPDVLMLDYTDYLRLKLSDMQDIQCFYNMDWKETTPLGRAEWIKVLGLLTGKGGTAEAIFTQKEQAYKKLTTKIQEIEEKPSVLFGQAYQGTWYLPDSNSYVATLIRDAGGLYQAPRNSGGGALSTEQVFAEHGADDIWLAWSSAYVSSLREFGQLQEHYTLFNAYKRGQVFLNDKRSSRQGGNDYWEQGPYFPEILLQDLMLLFHPTLVVQDSIRFWRRLE